MKDRIKNLLFESNKGKIKLNERASIFFFCLLLSTFFWFLSSLSKMYTTNLSIPLSYESYNKEFILIDKPPESIEITVNGSGFELLGEQLSLNRNAIKVDLTKAKKLGSNRFGIATTTLQNEVLNYLDKDLKFERITTDNLLFRTEKRIQKKLTVIPDLDLDFESSFNLMGDVIVEPADVVVSGPKNRIDSLEIIRTATIQKDEIADSLLIRYSFKSNKEYLGLTFEPTEVSILIPVNKFTEKVFELPVQVQSNTVEIRTFPERVKVVFLVPLDNYEQFSESEVEVIAELTNNLNEKKRLSLKVEGTPSYAKLLRIDPEKVEFIIKE